MAIDTHKDPFVAALQVLVAKALANGNCTISTVARSLNTSPRTIQRRLRSLGLSYLQVLDSVRCEQALTCLRDNELKSHQIATTLGYSHAGGFSRAFRCWTDMSPRQHRATITPAANEGSDGFRAAPDASKAGGNS